MEDTLVVQKTEPSSNTTKYTEDLLSTEQVHSCPRTAIVKFRTEGGLSGVKTLSPSMHVGDGRQVLISDDGTDCGHVGVVVVMVVVAVVSVSVWLRRC